MKILRGSVILAIASALLFACGADAAPVLRGVRVNGGGGQDAVDVPQYSLLEFVVNLEAEFENPYDPEQVALDADFTASSGAKFSVPGFFMVPQKREVRDGVEEMLADGPGEWHVRFTPSEIGEYAWKMTLRDHGGEATYAGVFTCTAAPAKGFVRVSEADSHYFAFDNGEGYFAIGHNLPIYHRQGQRADDGMRAFAAAKENWNRWWMASYGFGIEWDKQLGWYRQDQAARIDYMLELAGELGMYYMMCMDTHQDFRGSGWEKNPYNVNNGGPCETPKDWFTDETARAYYRKRLRYTVARWGFSPHVLAWEFGNEFEGWAGVTLPEMVPWHREMAAYLRGIDPFDHLITTSFWGSYQTEPFFEIPEIDIVQSHRYTNDDLGVTESLHGTSMARHEAYAKPHLYAEFGIRSHAETRDLDPEGWAVHNAQWVGLTSFCAGGVMPWWHENYIDPLNLYHHFTALANFTEDLPLGEEPWTVLQVGQPEWKRPQEVTGPEDAVVVTSSKWGKPAESEFAVLPSGVIAGGSVPQGLLHGAGHADLKNPPTFTVTYPASGQFIAHIGMVSRSGLVRVWVDDELAIEREFPCGEGLGKSSEWKEEWKLWQTLYDEDLSVEVPAGEHRIRIENTGGDWVRVESYTFTGCKTERRPRVFVAGMRSPLVSILWVQNPQSTWRGHLAGDVEPVEAFTLPALGMADGDWQVEYWNTWRGELVRTRKVRSQGGVLELRIPTLRSDIALKLRRM